MRKIFTTLLCAAVSLSLFANSYQTINGIYYGLNTTKHEAEVVLNDRAHMPSETDVVVPATVVYDEVTYTVTGVEGTGSLPVIDNTIESLELPNTIRTIGKYGLARLQALTQIVIPDSVAEIMDFAFFECSQLVYIELPYGKPATIGEAAFCSCVELAYIFIPQNITSIGDRAFRYCNQLNAVDLEAITPPTVGANAFDGCYATVIFNIPCADNYTSAAGWSDLAANTTDYAFSEQGVMLELQSEDPAKGSVARTGEAISCSNLTTTIEATPESGFAFLKWDDGNTDNPRTLTLVTSTALTAMFVEDTGTGIDETSTGASAVKRLVNGQLLIERDGRIYNAQGVEVK